MKLDLRKIATKLHLSLLGTAILSLLAFTLAFFPFLYSSVRQERTTLFVEQYTKALAETVSHQMERYRERLEQVASHLALLRFTAREEQRSLDDAAREPMPGLLDHGVFDLLVVVDSDGNILSANTKDRFNRPLTSGRLIQRHISEFPDEERAFLGASSGVGKQDWYKSKMVAGVTSEPAGDDASRGYAFALAIPIPQTRRVLLGIVNWEAVQKILDDVEPRMHAAGFPSGYAFMFARDGNRIIAHKFRDPAQRNLYGTRLIEDVQLPSLAQAARLGERSHRYEFPAGAAKVSGLARVDDADFGWIVGLGINDSDVVAPVWGLGWRLAGVGLLVLILALIASRVLSRRMTQGLLELRDGAMRIAEGRFSERVPARSRDEIGELAQAFNRMAGALSERDDLILEQQARLLERSRLEQELSIASEVQARLFPQARPPMRTLDYAGYCQPAEGVSGDYYDFLPLGSGKLGMILADVAGKGLPAALLMASMQAYSRSHAPLCGEDCAGMVNTLNAMLYQSTDSTRYATMFYAVYDDSKRELHYVNAGHFPPILVRATRAAAAVSVTASAIGARDAFFSEPPPERYRALQADSAPVGIFDSYAPVARRVELEPGDWLISYSDGVTEAVNLRGEEFGAERLIETVLAHQDASRTASQMLDAILEAVRQHTGDVQQFDDLTLMVARVL